MLTPEQIAAAEREVDAVESTRTAHWNAQPLDTSHAEQAMTRRMALAEARLVLALAFVRSGRPDVAALVVRARLSDGPQYSSCA